jgi:hypothetical protein
VQRDLSFVWVILFCASVMFSAPATAKSILVDGISMPDKVAGFKRGATKDLEKISKGAGKSVRYTKGSVWADVFVYPSAHKPTPQKYDDSVSSSELVRVQEVIETIAKSHNYVFVSKIDSIQFSKKFVCSIYIFSKSDSVITDYACITNRMRKFIKIRITNPTPNLDLDAVETFVRQWERD